MIRVVQFSGGKDSTALVLWAIEQWGVDGFTPVFCDTVNEHAITLAYIDKIDRDVLNGRLVRLKPTKYPGGMLPMLEDRKFMPASKSRFCTDELKTTPMEHYVKTLDDDVTVYEGARAEESERRRNQGARLWADRWDCWVERPLFDWTAAQVFEMHRKHGVEPNPLYTLGSSRVGCFPCVLIRHHELKRVGKMMPEIWDRMREMEQASGRPFFREDYIPKRFQTGKNEWGIHPTIDDVREYLFSATDAQLSFFDDGKPIVCMSVYNLCE